LCLRTFECRFNFVNLRQNVKHRVKTFTICKFMVSCSLMKVIDFLGECRDKLQKIFSKSFFIFNLLAIDLLMKIRQICNDYLCLFEGVLIKLLNLKRRLLTGENSVHLTYPKGENQRNRIIYPDCSQREN
jgi:hypothetical protein